MTPPEVHAAHEMHSFKRTDYKPMKDHLAAQHEGTMTMLPPGNSKILAENNNDGKVAITILVIGTRLIAYQF